jgi:hypothetical protein
MRNLVAALPADWDEPHCRKKRAAAETTLLVTRLSPPRGCLCVGHSPQKDLTDHSPKPDFFRKLFGVQKKSGFISGSDCVLCLCGMNERPLEAALSAPPAFAAFLWASLHGINETGFPLSRLHHWVSTCLTHKFCRSLPAGNSHHHPSRRPSSSCSTTTPTSTIPRPHHPPSPQPQPYRYTSVVAANVLVPSAPSRQQLPCASNSNIVGARLQTSK